MLLIIIMLSTGCQDKKINKEYEEFIKELKLVDSTSENLPLNITINVSEFSENLLSYTALIDKTSTDMIDIKALLIPNKKTDNSFPSIGIYDNPVTLTSESDEKGIKLVGYVGKYSDIDFKLIITFTNQNKIREKYFYTYNYRQNSI